MSATQIFYTLSTGACLLFLAGCYTSTQRADPYEVPTLAIDNAVQNAQSDPLIDPCKTLPIQWWTLFNDPQLAQMIQTTFERNPTLQAARANIMLANYAADRVRAALYPNLLWTADVSFQKLSETGLAQFGMVDAPVTGGKGGIPVYFTQPETALELTYDFDLWGKNRNRWRAAIGEVRARVADEAFARLRLGIAVAQAYFRLQIDYKRKAVTEALIDNKSQFVALLQNRVNKNLNDISTVRTSDVDLTAAKQQLLQIEGDIAVREHQLQAYLAGNFDEKIAFTGVIEQPLPRVPLPCDISLNLIAQRPDITAQLWLIESAGRRIEVAQAGFYPDVNLTALAGFQSIHLRELFYGKSTYYNIDPAISLPIFDGGLLKANLRGSEVDYDVAIFQYNQLILTAVQEVLDGISVLRITEQQLKEFQKQVHDQRELFGLTELRMQHNLNSRLDGLVSEGNLLVAQNRELIALGNTLEAILALLKALGGGYYECG